MILQIDHEVTLCNFRKKRKGRRVVRGYHGRFSYHKNLTEKRHYTMATFMMLSSYGQKNLFVTGCSNKHHLFCRLSTLNEYVGLLSGHPDFCRNLECSFLRLRVTGCNFDESEIK